MMMMAKLLVSPSLLKLPSSNSYALIPLRKKWSNHRASRVTRELLLSLPDPRRRQIHLIPHPSYLSADYARAQTPRPRLTVQRSTSGSRNVYIWDPDPTPQALVLLTYLQTCLQSRTHTAKLETNKRKRPNGRSALRSWPGRTCTAIRPWQRCHK